jgi:hypothetical protein
MLQKSNKVQVMVVEPGALHRGKCAAARHLQLKCEQVAQFDKRIKWAGDSPEHKDDWCMCRCVVAVNSVVTFGFFGGGFVALFAWGSAASTCDRAGDRAD